MKICKNCGRETDDTKIRCPYCGYLFEEDMDGVLSRMKSNLNSYKQELAATQVPAKPQAQPVQPVQQAQPVQQVQPAQQAMPVQPVQQVQQPVQQDNSKERFELLSEVAQLKGELRAMHSEIERLHAAPQQPQIQYVAAPAAQPAQQPVQPAQPAQPAPGPTTVIYTQPYVPQAQMQPQYAPQPVVQQVIPAYAQGDVAYARQGYAPVAKKKKRSGNRIVLSILCILLLGVSIGLFFVDWIDWEASSIAFKGFDGVLYIFGQGETAGFTAYLEAIKGMEFIGNETVASICRSICYYVVNYGVIVYAVFLVLGFPLLFSLSGTVSCKGWHRFVAWMSFIVAAVLFGIFCWVSGFSSVTMLFLVGGGANFVRGLFLAFYRGKRTNKDTV